MKEPTQNFLWFSGGYLRETVSLNEKTSKAGHNFVRWELIGLLEIAVIVSLWSDSLLEENKI